MNRAEISSKVTKIVADTLQIGLEEVTPRKRLVEDFGADSLDLVELSMALEEGFDLIISESEDQGIRTIQALIDFIEKKLGEQQC